MRSKSLPGFKRLNDKRTPKGNASIKVPPGSRGTTGPMHSHRKRGRR